MDSIRQFSIISHRGVTELAPENTLAAFRKALELGFDIEFDLRWTKDKHLVVIHNGSSIDRTTNGYGLVHDLTLKELKFLDAGSWFNPSFKGEKIPTFEEVLNLLQGKALLAINFKVVGTEEAIVRFLNDYKGIDNVFIFDVSLETVKKFKSLNPKIPIAARASDSQKENFWDVTQKAFSYVDVVWADECNSPFITSDMVAEAHRCHKRIYASIVNDIGRWKELVQMNIDGICTDHPIRLKEVLGSFSS